MKKMRLAALVAVMALVPALGAMGQSNEGEVIVVLDIVMHQREVVNQLDGSRRRQSQREPQQSDERVTHDETDITECGSHNTNRPNGRSPCRPVTNDMPPAAPRASPPGAARS